MDAKKREWVWTACFVLSISVSPFFCHSVKEGLAMAVGLLAFFSVFRIFFVCPAEEEELREFRRKIQKDHLKALGYLA